MVNQNLQTLPVETIEIQKQQTPINTTIGSSEFCEILLKELYDGKVWRTSKVLAEKTNVDAIQLDEYLRLQPSICCRPSKDEGVFLYALIKRLESDIDTKTTKVESAMRPLVSEEDRYALSSLHSSFILLNATLDKFALKIHERNPEAFTNLVAGKNKLEAGIVLYANKLKADMTKLPKV